MRKKLKLFAYLTLILFFSITQTQAQDISFSNIVAPELNVCEEGETFTVGFTNTSGLPMTNITVDVNFPTGILYKAGTLSEISNFNVQEANISNLAAISFSMDNLPDGNTVTFKIDAEARFDAVAYQQGGNVFRNTVQVNYSKSGQALSDNEMTDPFNILIPALSITKVNKMSQNVFVGQTFTRQVTIVNGGFGKLTSFVLNDEFDHSLLALVAVDKGVADTTAGTITFSSADFTSIGDGDGFFERNEALVVTQTITAVGCTNEQSKIYATWGCDNQISSSNNKFPATNISLYAPNVVGVALPSFNTCMDINTPDQQGLMLINKGSGPANTIDLSIYQTKDNGYDQGVYSRIDENSVQYKIGANAAYTSITPYAANNTTSTGNLSCLGSDAKGRIRLDFPVLQPGDTLYLVWDSYTCDNPTSCEQVDLIGWDYSFTYTDMCNSKTYSKTNLTGQPPKKKFFSVFAEFPSDMVEGQTEEFSFRLTSTTFDMPEGNNPYFEVEITIPVGLTYSGNSADLVFEGNNTTWTPSSVTYDNVNKILVGQYPLPAPFSLLNSEIKLDLTVDCSEPGAGSGNKSVGMQLFYIMDDACSPIFRFPLTCPISTLTNLHCPGVNCVGLGFNGFTAQRVSFGQPDNDQNGTADNSGSLDMSRIKLNRVMADDTVETVFRGAIHTNATYTDWQYGYAKSVIPDGKDMTVLNATLTVNDASTGQTLTCTNVPFSSSNAGNTKTVEFDFSIDTLVALGCSTFSGFVFEDTDDVFLTVQYKAGNIGPNYKQVTITNDFYVSDIKNPTSNANQFQCDTWGGNFTLIGYEFQNYNRNSWTANSCTRTVNQYFRFRMGRGPENANLFPYEYRNWGHVREARVEIPNGYVVSGTRFRQYRTRYTNVYSTQTQNNFSPVSVTPTATGNSYVYDLASLYDGNGGTIDLSDDGFYGYLQLTLVPACTLPINQWEDLEWFFDFQESAFLGGGTTGEVTSMSGDDRIRYRRANLSLSTVFQTIEGISKEVSWDVKVTNNNVANSSNMFFVFNSSSINVTRVVDLSNNKEVTVSNDIFHLGNLNRGKNKTFRVYANYTSCGVEQLDVSVGYDCEGYPGDIASYNCGLVTYPLYIDPQPSELQVRIKSETPDDPCEGKLNVAIEMLSARLAHIDDLFVRVDVPSSQSLTINADSTEINYPESAGWSSITTPSILGDAYTFTAADLHALIDADGVPGVTDITKNLVNLKFQIDMNSNFVPGDRITISVGAKRPCGDDLPTISLEYDPNAVFDKIENIGLGGNDNNWGTSWADYDGDGNVDLFLTNYETNQANQLYKNNGDGTFTKKTDINVGTDLASSTASTWGDYDNDGDLDLFVANNIGAKNFLYRNNGDGTFVKILNDPIVNDIGYAHGAAWGDYDNDGFLDMFVAEFFPTRFNNLYHNNGDGTFSKVSTGAIITEAASSVSGVWGDYDNDGDLDLFVANTRDEDNSLYRNDGGAFVREASSIVSNDGGKSVGASWGDYDNDGDLDLFVANSGEQNNFLYRNDGGTFTKINTGAVVNDGGHSHGSSWIDFDNDGDLDLFVGNDQDQNNFLYSNNGDGTFTAIDNAITADGGKSFGSAWADIDNDGDLDLFVANHDGQENSIYENVRGRCYSKACVTLVGTKSNASAIGAKVHVKARIFGIDTWQMREITSQSGGGISGQNEMKAFIGLGNATQADSIIIEWPSGIITRLGATNVNDCSMTFTEPNGSEICGTIYFDENENCTQEANEKGIPNVNVLIQPGNRQTFTDSLGNYSITVEPGTYTVTHGQNSTWAQECPADDASLTVDVLAVGQQYCGNNFSDTTGCLFPNLELNIATTAFRVGFETLIAITYSNNGAFKSTGTQLQVDFGPHINPLNSSLNWDSEAGSVYSWTIGDVAFGETKTIFIGVDVLTSAVIGDDLTVTGQLTAVENDCEPANNNFNLVSEAIGAIDPNDILVSPEGVILGDQELTYKIRFQNVGNAPVQTVVLRDELPESLDLSTLVRGGASHPYQFRIEGERTLVWEFNNIHLEDSTSNEPESHGFATFRITPKADLPNGTEIPNTAAIFFDQSAPVITNTVINIIGVPGEFDKGELGLYPNPMETVTNAVFTPLDNNTSEQLDELFIYDALGRQVQHLTGLSGRLVEIKRERMTSGYYVVRAISNRKREYIGKLIVF